MWHLHFYKRKQHSHAFLIGYTVLFSIVTAKYIRMWNEYLSSSRPPGLLTTCSQVPWPEPLWKFLQTLPNKGAKEALQHTPDPLRQISARFSPAACLSCKFCSGSCKRGVGGLSSSKLCIPSQWSLWESCQNNVRLLLLSREVLSSFLSFSLTLRCL